MIFRAVGLGLGLVIIVVGMVSRTPSSKHLLPIGMVLVASAMFYFLRGILPSMVLIPVMLAVVSWAAVVELLLIRRARSH
jgi:hypothetical protein